MKVIHAASCFLPDTHGGTEVYVAELATHLQKQGIQTVVTAPREGQHDATYRYNDLEVYRYPVLPNPSLAQWREEVPHSNFAMFAEWLNQQSATIYHQHSYRFDCGLHHLQLAKQLGIPTVLTMHLPEPVCLRKTMMRNGTDPCDGKIEVTQCGSCLGMSEKVPAPIAQSLTHVPLSLGRSVKTLLHQASSPRIRQLGTTLSTPSLVADNRRRVHQMADAADYIVTVCQWMYDVLVRNGIPTEKLLFCKQGSPVASQPHLKVARSPNAPLRIGFLGRWHENKGIHILVDAIGRLPRSVPVELIIHSSLHGKFHSGSAIQARVMQIAETDERIHIKDVLPRDKIAQAVAGFDLLAIPSQWFENGPLVVQEAYAVGTPVIGSNLGGIPEMIQQGVNGWLVTAGDVDAWRDAISYLATHPDVIETLHQGIQPVRTFETVADEMKTLYQRILVQSASV